MSQNTETSIPSGIDDRLNEFLNNIISSVNLQIAFNKSQEANLINFHKSQEANLVNFNKFQTTKLTAIINTANQFSEYLQIFKSQTHNNNDQTNERLNGDQVVKYFKRII